MNNEASSRVSLLRSSSDAATRVFATILTRSPISRADVARFTGLSQAAVTKAVTPLVAAGLIDDTLDSRRHGLPGRPASPVAVVPDALIAIGIKVNPDELVGVACDLTTRVIASQQPSLSSNEPAAVIDAIVDLVRSLEDELDGLGNRLASIGVSVSGDVDTSTGVVRESTHMGWTDVHLGTELASRLGQLVVVENDVRALTIGEHWFGVGLGTASFAMVTIGRGIGSGLHLNGEVVEGAYGVAGEIGHLPLTSPDKICACGRRGCVEAVAATAAIVATVSAAHGRPLTVEDVVALAHAGDPAATAAFNEAATVIGTAIASLVNLVGPEVVIIGGEAVSNFDLFEERLLAAFAEHAFGTAGRCRMIVRPHTFEDWARGAAATAIRSLVA
ncbi:sugar kinase [Nonomuraea aridisoli]|uniref:Sugar kinase n=2 Tax=Nonomuraea aridisoli TaxID=2070368 RepID=A0A2W2EN42_9ACTN|nr:sugar kinase [Nonomuraea aridisoli]